VSSAEKGIAPANGVSAREVMRLDAYVSIALGIATFFLSGSIARSLGLASPWLPVIAAVAVVVSGIDELAFAVGRRVRRFHFLPFAAVNVAAAAAALAVLVLGGSALSDAVFGILGAGVVTFGWFAVADLRAMRTL